VRPDRLREHDAATDAQCDTAVTTRNATQVPEASAAISPTAGGRTEHFDMSVGDSPLDRIPPAARAAAIQAAEAAGRGDPASRC
jgi:hypothetical protein